MMKCTVFALLTFCMLWAEPFAVIGSLSLQAQTKSKTTAKPKDKEQVEYLCPMHPEVSASKPGKCRICGYEMEKQETPKSLSGTGPGEIAALFKEVKGYKFDVLLAPAPPIDPEAVKNMKEIPNYRVDVTVRNLKTKKDISDAEVWFHIVHPNGRNIMPRLNRQRDSYFADIYLPATGPYTFMVHANMKSGNVVANFKKVMH
jgi:hypothetical protein